MKTQAKTILEFKKNGIVELNENKLKLIYGGTGSINGLRTGTNTTDDTDDTDDTWNGSGPFCLTTT